MTIINLFQALIDGPAHGVKRQSLQFSRMSLLDYKIKIPRSAREKTIKKGIDYNLSLKQLIVQLSAFDIILYMRDKCWVFHFVYYIFSFFSV